MQLAINIGSSVSIIGVNGLKLTFPEKKAKTLLGVLAITPGNRVSRRKASSLFWADRSKTQAAASLRQSLSVTRRRLGHCSDILQSDRESIWLLPNTFSVRYDNQPEVLFEDARMAYPHFSLWLDTMGFMASPATQVKKGNPNSHSLDNSSEEKLDHDQALLAVGLLPPIVHGNTDHCNALLLQVSERSNHAILQFGVASVLDYRHMFSPNLGQYFNNNGTMADVFLQFSIVELTAKHKIYCRLYDALDNRLIWSNNSEISNRFTSIENIKIEIFVNQLVDFLVSFFQSPKFIDHTSSRKASAYALLAIGEILKTHNGDLHRADKLLQDAYSIEPNIIYQAWRTQVYVNLIGEQLVSNQAPYIECLKEIVVKTTELGQFNPLCLSLVAHAHSFIFEDYATAKTLFKQMMTLEPSQAICYDMAATTDVYTGDVQQAIKNSTYAYALGKFSPFKYSFETTCSMANMLAGNYREAAEFADQVLQKHDSYKPAIRYGIAAKNLAGDTKGSEKLLGKFIGIEKNISQSALKSKRYPIRGTTELKRRVTDGIIAALENSP